MDMGKVNHQEHQEVYENSTYNEGETEEVYQQDPQIQVWLQGSTIRATRSGIFTR